MVQSKERLGIGSIEKDKLYTVGELMKYVPLSKSGLYLALKRMEVPCVKMAKRSLYLGKDFLTFIEDCKE